MTLRPWAVVMFAFDPCGINVTHCGSFFTRRGAENYKSILEEENKEAQFHVLQRGKR